MKRVMTWSVALAAGGLVAQGALAAPVSKAKGPMTNIKRPLQLPPPSGPDGPGFSDNFDAYANGSGLVPQNGWLYWGATGQVNATVDNTLAASAPNSVVSSVETDVVQVFNITSGVWEMKVKTYYPSTATGTGYFIALNTYTNPYVSGGNWSLEVSFNGTTNLVSSVNRSVANGGPGPTNLPLIKDQWVELKINIDLNNDTFTMTYGGQGLVTTNGKWSWNASGTAGAVRIQAIDLYSPMAGFRWDDFSLQPAGPAPCYPNCDGSTVVPILNVNDFICFQTKYAANDPYANCDGSTVVPILNVNDFICFQSSYAAGCP